MSEHAAVVIAGGGPTGLMLAGELALAGVDVAIVERRASQDLTGSRAATQLPGRDGRASRFPRG
jgi:3-(3-hydroxy-phenyl)propionate hydroxylase